MTAKRLHARLNTAIRKAPAKAGTSVMARWAEEWRRDVEAFLPHVPADLRDALRDRLGDMDAAEALSSLLLWPFARWAPPMPADYVFPRVLIEFTLDPPFPFWFGHHCGRCGLVVPLRSWDGPGRPDDWAPFPECPACGGRTSHAAFYRPDSAAEVTS